MKSWLLGKCFCVLLNLTSFERVTAAPQLHNDSLVAGDTVSLLQLNAVLHTRNDTVLEESRKIIVHGEYEDSDLLSAQTHAADGETLLRARTLHPGFSWGMRLSESAFGVGGIDESWLHQLIKWSVASLPVQCNDLLWFLPFALSSQRASFAVVLVVGKILVAALSILTVSSSVLIQKLAPGAQFNVILSTMSSALLFVCSVVLFREWIHELKGSRPTTDASDSSSQKLSSSNTKAKDGMTQHCTLTHSNLIMIILVGNVDNFAVYLSFLQAGVISPAQLLICALLCSLLVVALAWIAIRSRLLTQAIELVPLCAIIFGIWIWSLTWVLPELITQMHSS